MDQTPRVNLIGRINIILNSFSFDCKNSEVFPHFNFKMISTFVMKSSNADTIMKFTNIARK